MVSKIDFSKSYPKSVEVQDAGSVKGKLDLQDTVKVTYQNKQTYKVSLKEFVGGQMPGISRFGPFSISRDRLQSALNAMGGGDTSGKIDSSVKEYLDSPAVVKSDAEALYRGFADKNKNTRFYAMQEYDKIIPKLDLGEAKKGAAALHGLFKDSDVENRHEAADLFKKLIPKLDKDASHAELRAMTQLVNDPSVDDRVKTKIREMIVTLESQI